MFVVLIAFDALLMTPLIVAYWFWTLDLMVVVGVDSGNIPFAISTFLNVNLERTEIVNLPAGSLIFLEAFWTLTSVKSFARVDTFLHEHQSTAVFLRPSSEMILQVFDVLESYQRAQISHHMLLSCQRSSDRVIKWRVFMRQQTSRTSLSSRNQQSLPIDRVIRHESRNCLLSLRNWLFILGLTLSKLLNSWFEWRNLILLVSCCLRLTYRLNLLLNWWLLLLRSESLSSLPQLLRSHFLLMLVLVT